MNAYEILMPPIVWLTDGIIFAIQKELYIIRN